MTERDSDRVYVTGAGDDTRFVIYEHDQRSERDSKLIMVVPVKIIFLEEKVCE
jgi:hypothetical protein